MEKSERVENFLVLLVELTGSYNLQKKKKKAGQKRWFHHFLEHTGKSREQDAAN